MNPPEVSFVVIAHNEQDKICQTLDSILRQESPLPFEVLVIDDGSTDATSEAVRERFASSKVRVVELPANLGRGGARNIGVSEATGKQIAFIDSDILLPPTWLEQCVVHLQRNDAVGGTAVPDGDVAYIHRRFRLHPKIVPSTTEITGNNGLYSSDVFDLVNFDRNLRNGEDVELNHAMNNAGFKASRVPNLVVQHCETKTYRQSIAWLYESGVGASHQLLRHPSLRIPDISFALTLVGVATGSSMAILKEDVRWLLPGIVCLATVSAGHLHTRFHLRRTPIRGLAAAFANIPLIAAYMVGRIVGILL